MFFNLDNSYHNRLIVIILILMQKQYAALVWISRPLKDEDFQSVTSLKEVVSLLDRFCMAVLAH